MPARRIVILCDGTSNEIESDRTNVLRLYGALEKDDAQLVFYDPGVGTFGAANSWSKVWRKTVEIFGLATGWGLDHNVKEAYRFLVENYREEVPAVETRGGKVTKRAVPADEIHIFGFSRGAYTARVLAGFIHAVGLVRPINLNLVDYAYGAYRALSEGDETAEVPGSRNPRKNKKAELDLYGRVLNPRKPEIRCLGLFDTVGSVIEWGRFGPRLQRHLHVSVNPCVRMVRHAVAIDERRTMFQPVTWRQPEDTDQDTKEVWFSGVHGDVGGGYPEKKSGLAKIPLLWMIDETRQTGLRYDDDVVKLIVRGEAETKTAKDKVDAAGRPEEQPVAALRPVPFFLWRWLGKVMAFLSSGEEAPDDTKHYEPPDAKAPSNDSMTFGWAVLEYLPRRLPRDRKAPLRSFAGWYIPYYEPRIIPDGAAIHNSVFERRGTPSDYDQPNIPDDHEKV